MFYFRPLPALSVSCAVLFASLIALGVWQLDRLQWKLALIEFVNEHLREQPVSLDEHEHIYANNHFYYRRVSLTGRFDNSKEAYIFGTEANGVPGYHVIVPFMMGDGRIFLIDRGIVPKEKLNPAARRAGQVEGIAHIVGVWRIPDAPGLFTPAPDIAHRIWYAHDLDAIAKNDGIKLFAPVIIEADATPNKGGWPRGGQTVVKFRNEHLQYAITWFGLASVLFSVYIAYHISRGRLGFRR